MSGDWPRTSSTLNKLFRQHTLGGHMVTDYDLLVSKSLLILIGSFIIFSVIGV